MKDNRPGKAARNERRKAMATTLNAVSVAFFVAALIQPALTGKITLLTAAAALAVVIALQVLLHYLLGRVED